MIKEKKKKYWLGIFIFVAVLLVTGVSYALWSITLTQETNNVITTGCFNVEYTENNPINLQSAYPITDEEGRNLVPYTFTITNTCDTLVKYQVNLEVLNTSTLLNHSYLKVQFDDENSKLLNSYSTVPKILKNATTAYELGTGVLSKKGSKTFTLRLWLEETSPAIEEVMSKTFESKIVIQTVGEINRYTEDALNGADPVIKENLIPVIIADNGTVTKADIKSEWYNYEKKSWANAVILKDESITYADNATILEDNIESYFVWIPRYRYKIFNDTLYSSLSSNIDTTKVQRIEVEFESKDVTPSNGSHNNEWLTHPAFTSFDSNGMWVGKFETSKSDNAPENSIYPKGVQIKPNVVSWRNIQVGNAFYTSYHYERNLDSHLMKNTEWGAVAYLQHSKYGSETSVRINNHSGNLTGYASTKEPTCGWIEDNRDCNKYGTTSEITQPYNTDIGYLASTTGNISGIYDMSGGAGEYVMGVMEDWTEEKNPLSGKNISTNSGFVGYESAGTGLFLESGYSWPNEKYYDKYESIGKNGETAQADDFSRRKLGDATGEMGPFGNITYVNNSTRQISSWYSNDVWFIAWESPWFARGSSYAGGKDAGIFSTWVTAGNAAPIYTFRIILTP